MVRIVTERCGEIVLHLGLVTYNLAKNWDIPMIIRMCSETGFEAVEPVSYTHLTLPTN